MNTENQIISTKSKISRGRTPEGEPNPVDIHVGDRIRQRRALLGLSQEGLAKRMGISFQQIQKYERGSNRVGASRIWDFSRIFDVPVNYFFEDIDVDTAAQSPRNLKIDTLPEVEEVELLKSNPLNSKEAMELVTSYYKITNRTAAQLLLEFMCAIAKTPTDEDKKIVLNEGANN